MISEEQGARRSGGDMGNIGGPVLKSILMSYELSGYLASLAAAVEQGRNVILRNLSQGR